MQEQLISFETAKLAKEKGFNETFSYGIGVAYYNKDGILGGTCLYGDHTLKASTQSLLQKWLREEYKINIFINCEMNCSPMESKWFKYNYLIYLGREPINEKWYNGTFKYEDTLEQGLQEALKFIL